MCMCVRVLPRVDAVTRVPVGDWKFHSAFDEVNYSHSHSRDSGVLGIMVLCNNDASKGRRISHGLMEGACCHDGRQRENLDCTYRLHWFASYGTTNFFKRVSTRSPSVEMALLFTLDSELSCRSSTQESGGKHCILIGKVFAVWFYNGVTAFHVSSRCDASGHNAWNVDVCM